ncbi:hypothetical protein [Candidatus Carsonella ruddii]|uniref:hypothetical protein n=1 Tax=Carsonella ruddii TaxID=114186 RepID=UPI003D9A5216
MFIEKQILLKSGDGGNGCISYECINGKFYANGGNGGNGGNLFILTNNNFKLPNKNYFSSNNGKNGMKKQKTGKNGHDYILKLPIGVCILLNNKKKYIVLNNFFLKLLEGGIGGKGNYNYKNFYNSKIANFGQKGKFIILKIKYIYFYNKCYINISNIFIKNNNFNFKNNFISKIYIFYINLIFFKIFFKIIKFFLYFLYIKNLKNVNYWIIIDGIEHINNFKKIKNIKFILIPFFIISNNFNIGIKKFYHFLNLWKNS